MLINTLRKHRLMLFTTVIPTLLSVLYFGLVASDVYVSESRFVVRSPERQVTSPLALMLKGAGFAKAQDDSYVVQDYILSRDALKALDERLKVKSAYSASGIDVFSRFAPLGLDDSFEAFHRYFQNKVDVQIDTASSITTLKAYGFSAEDAGRVNQTLLELSEDLVNRLNERGRQDMIRFASEDVAEAEKKAKAAALAVAEYRNRKGVMDPEKQSALPLQHVAKIQDELIAAKTQLAQVESVAPGNPQVPVLRQRIRLLEEEIKAKTQLVAGGGEGSLAGKAAEYQRLALDKEFADKMLASALSTLEQARQDAQRKQLYLERIVAPSLPDAATEPRRLRNIFVTFVVSLMLWGILALLIAGVREHNE
jgi:capsular polysaccharide transport system permease protein